MAPAFRHPNTHEMTEEEFQEYRRKVYHRGWDIDESVTEDGTDLSALITKEVLQEWHHYRHSVHDREASRNGGKTVDVEIEIHPEEEALISEEVCKEWRTYIRRYRRSVVRDAPVDGKGRVENRDGKKKSCVERATNQEHRSEETDLMSRVKAGCGTGVEQDTCQNSPRKGKRARVEEGVKALQRMLLHRIMARKVIEESFQEYLQRHLNTVTMPEAELRAWADRSYCDWASIDTDMGTYFQRNEDEIRVLIGRGEMARQRRFHPADPFGDEHYVKEKEEDNHSSSEKILIGGGDPRASAISLPWYGESADWHDTYGCRENGRRTTFWVRWQQKNDDDDVSSSSTLASRVIEHLAGSIISDQIEEYDDASQPPETIDLYNELKEEVMWERLQTRSFQRRGYLPKSRKRERVKKGLKKAVQKMKVW